MIYRSKLPLVKCWEYNVCCWRVVTRVDHWLCLPVIRSVLSLPRLPLYYWQSYYICRTLTCWTRDGPHSGSCYSSLNYTVYTSDPSTNKFDYCIEGFCYQTALPHSWLLLFCRFHSLTTVKAFRFDMNPRNNSVELFLYHSACLRSDMSHSSFLYSVSCSAEAWPARSQTTTCSTLPKELTPTE